MPRARACVFRDQMVRINSDRKNVPCLLIGNKADLDEDRAVEFEMAVRWSALWNVNYIETSAKTKLNVDKVLLIDRVLNYDLLRWLAVASDPVLYRLIILLRLT